jgi:hypothetical protein
MASVVNGVPRSVVKTYRYPDIPCAAPSACGTRRREWVDGWLALFGPADVQGGRSTKLNLAPFELAGFLGAQAVHPAQKDG